MKRKGAELPWRCRRVFGYERCCTAKKNAAAAGFPAPSSPPWLYQKCGWNRRPTPDCSHPTIQTSAPPSLPAAPPKCTISKCNAKEESFKIYLWVLFWLVNNRRRKLKKAKSLQHPASFWSSHGCHGRRRSPCPPPQGSLFPMALRGGGEESGRCYTLSHSVFGWDFHGGQGSWRRGDNRRLRGSVSSRGWWVLVPEWWV